MCDRMLMPHIVAYCLPLSYRQPPITLSIIAPAPAEIHVIGDVIVFALCVADSSSSSPSELWSWCSPTDSTGFCAPPANTYPGGRVRSLICAASPEPLVGCSEISRIECENDVIDSVTVIEGRIPLGSVRIVLVEASEVRKTFVVITFDRYVGTVRCSLEHSRRFYD